MPSDNNELSNDEECSEFEIFDLNVVNNVKSHTLSAKSFVDETSKKREMEKKIKVINDI
jgi:hypothetical protein